MTIPINKTNYENPPAYAPATTMGVVYYGDNKQTEQEVIRVPDAYAVAPAIVAPSHASRTSNPPPNCPDGGQWGTLQYTGSKTCALTCLGCILCPLCGLFLLTCPQDEKDAYCVNGKLYDAAGTSIGLARHKSFIPERR